MDWLTEGRLCHMTRHDVREIAGCRLAGDIMPDKKGEVTMPSLVISQDTVSVNLSSRHLELVKRREGELLSEYDRLNVPLVDIDRVVVCGRPSVSVAVLQRLMKDGIPSFFISSRGRWVGSLCPDNNMNAGRRIRQYELSLDKKFALGLARRLVFAKIRNSRRVLQRLAANRQISHHISHTEALDKLRELADGLGSAAGLDELRGFEGMAAAIYFGQLGKYFPEDIPFTVRSRRPPKDAANALLSWTYSIVLGEIDGAVRSHGLDACIGCLHAVSHGTPALSLDLLEPLRGPCCDMTVLNMLNHKHLTKEDFEYRDDDDGTYLKPEARKKFFQTYELAMTRKFTPYQGSVHVDFRDVIRNSVFSVLRAMEGQDDVEFFIMP